MRPVKNISARLLLLKWYIWALTLVGSTVADTRHLHTHQQNERGLQGVLTGGLMRVYNNDQLLVAIMNPTVTEVHLSAPRFTFNTTLINSLMLALRLSPPLLITRNLTIRGASELEHWPVLDFGFSKGMLQLQGGCKLIFINIIAVRARYDYPGRVPGLDLLARTQDGTLSEGEARSSAFIALGCYSPEQMEQDFALMKQPEGAPQNKWIFNQTQAGCVHDTSKPYMQQCYKVKVLAERVIFYGDDDANGRVTPNNILFSMMDLTVFCYTVVTDDCVKMHGSPYFCYLALVQQKKQDYEDLVMGIAALSPSPSQLAFGQPMTGMQEQGPSPASSHSSSGSSNKNMVLVAGLACGGAGLVIIAGFLTLLLVVRRRRRRRKTRAEACQWANGAAGCEGTDSKAMPVEPAASDHTRSTDTPKDPFSQQLPPELSIVVLNANDRLNAGQAEYSDPDAPVTIKMPPRVNLRVRLDDCSNNGQEVEQSATDTSGDQEGSPRGSQPEVPSSDADNRVQLLPVVRGRGGFGRVVEGLFHGQRVAVKMLAEMQDQHCNAGLLAQSFEHEVQILARCHHPNVVRLLAACVQPPQLCLVLELMETSLDKVIYGNPEPNTGPMPLEKVMYIAIQVSRALAYLHPTITHRDLKPANVLLNNPWSDRPVVKLTDFGLSRLRETVVPTEHPDAGTPSYMAPECFDIVNRTITHQADIFSLGILLWEMIGGKPPWQGLPPVAIAFKVAYREQRPNLLSLPPDRLPRKLFRLLTQCWETDPLRRPSADEVAKELTLVLQMLTEQKAASA